MNDYVGHLLPVTARKRSETFTEWRRDHMYQKKKKKKEEINK